MLKENNDMTLFYNIYARNSYYMLGTVSVEQSSIEKPSVAAIDKAVEKLHGVDASDIVAIMSTQEQFFKTGI